MHPNTEKRSEQIELCNKESEEREREVGKGSRRREGRGGREGDQGPRGLG